MGGQACILYGASEFSRDVDIAILANPENLARFRVALDELGAEVIAVPPFDPELLARGHAVHFRCGAADGLRLDVMSVMRGVGEFESCWERRTIYQLDGVGDIDVLGLEDLVAAKKTRRDKDWPVVRRLVDVHYGEFAAEPTEARIAFWLRELRTPEALVDCVRRAPEAAARVALEREATAFAIRAASGEAPFSAIIVALQVEEDRERAADEEYWRPLQNELEAMRHAAVRKRPPSPKKGRPPI
ncbi:MAG TPA: hypothetical protein VFK39_05585 [Gemmatimonadaceae bacterium]|nr:hypothetical protein [Gemmatimonadaceae bacterium]